MFIHCSIERDTGVLSMMATKHHSNNYNLDTLYHRERKILFIKNFVVVRILCGKKYSSFGQHIMHFEKHFTLLYGYGKIYPFLSPQN